MTGPRPSFSIAEVAALITEHYNLTGQIEPLPSYDDQNFSLDCGTAGKYVIKIANGSETVEIIHMRLAVMERLNTQFASPIAPQGIKSKINDFASAITGGDGKQCWVYLLTWVEGEPISSLGRLSKETIASIGSTLGLMTRALADFEHPAMNREFIWDLRQTDGISPLTHHIRDPKRQALVDRFLLQYRARLGSVFPTLPMSVIHGDANDENLLVKQNELEGWEVSGLIDFGDVLYTYTVAELAIACAYLILHVDDPVEAITCVAAAYHKQRKLGEPELEALFPMIVMRLCVSVTMSTVSAENDPDNAHAQIAVSKIWETLAHLETMDWLDVENRVRVACGFQPKVSAPISADQLLKDRHQVIGPSLSLSYESPLVITKGRGQYLFDPHGRAYLDCVNNVCHVGHAHPAVVAAISEQAARLNTNTRYLHPNLTEYATRLTATLPDPLEVVFFVNSGSEANELALRLAQTRTGRTDVIVVDVAYHGNTGKMVEMSPYKCEGPGGKGLADWVHKVPIPDRYRGEFRGQGDDVGQAYAAQVGEMVNSLEAMGRSPAMFICESIMGCGGQVVLPNGYLREAFEHVRAAGGLCVVDEVQVGFGRVGIHMWAFQTQGVVPDIVTLGKPMGNGHPIGAVITTREIAQSFNNGMEYFNTFGGNPVSCAAGLAVLDVIEKEQLQQKALRVGGYLMSRLQELAQRYNVIGDVRGLGLFMGVELISDQAKLTPAPDLTTQIIEQVKGDGILLSSDGPYHNVIKIKPPLQFDETDADLLVGALGRAMGHLSP